MPLTTPDVIGLLLLGLATVIVGLNLLYIDRVLNDPDHPEHEIAKEAMEEAARQTATYPFEYEWEWWMRHYDDPDDEDRR